MSRRDCTCGAKHRKDCICEGVSIRATPSPETAPDAGEEAAARAILDEQARGTPLSEAADRVFAMSSEELGQAAVEGARRTRGPGRRRGGSYDPRGCF